MSKVSKLLLLSYQLKNFCVNALFDDFWKKTFEHHAISKFDLIMDEIVYRKLSINYYSAAPEKKLFHSNTKSTFDSRRFVDWGISVKRVGIVKRVKCQIFMMDIYQKRSILLTALLCGVQQNLE